MKITAKAQHYLRSAWYYEKGFYDALTGIVWVDDSIITDKNVKKRYTADLARIELKITEVQSC